MRSEAQLPSSTGALLIGENRCETTVFDPCESCQRTPISELVVVRFSESDETYLVCSGCAAFAVLQAEQFARLGPVTVTARGTGRVLL